MSETNYAQFNAGIEYVMRATNKDLRSILKDQSRLFVRDAIGLTPPTTDQPIVDIAHYGRQQKAGIKALKNDIEKIFIEPKEFTEKMGEDLRKWILRYCKEGSFGKLKTLLQKFKINIPIAVIPTEQLHNERRDGRGRTRKRQRVLVMNTGSVAGFIKERSKAIGMAKSGWVNAARKLGLKGLPDWITRHNQPGDCAIVDIGNTFSISVENRCSYAQKHNRGNLKIIQRALDRRGEAMVNQMNAFLGKKFQGYK